jgi:hypothetical protein
MNSHEDISKKSHRLFEQSVETLDTATANRLRLMRRDALSQNAPSRFNKFLLPVSATLAVALGIAIFLPQMQSSDNFTEQDVVYVSAEDDTDAELLDWLAVAPVDVPVKSQGQL